MVGWDVWTCPPKKLAPVISVIRSDPGRGGRFPMCKTKMTQSLSMKRRGFGLESILVDFHEVESTGCRSFCVISTSTFIHLSKLSLAVAQHSTPRPQFNSETPTQNKSLHLN